MAGAAALVLLAPLVYPLLTGRMLTRDDLAAMHLPFRYLYSESLRNGHLLLWTPAYHAGYFLQGSGEAGMTHPLHLLLYSLLPLGAAFNLEIISSYLFLFAGMYLLWRALQLPIESALLGAALSAFSAFTIYNIMHVNHIATLAHAPWLLLACHGILTGKGRPGLWFALAAIVTGSQILTGHPQYMWITLVAVLAFCLWLRPRKFGAPLAALATAAIFGVLIGGIQLVPSIEFFGDSARTQWSREDALSLSLSPVNLIQLWMPFAFRFRVFAPANDQFPHEFIVYNGAFCTAALAWIAVRWRTLPHRRLAVALLAFGAVALLLAFGKYGGIYALLINLPVLSGLRGSSRHIVLFQFALAGLAAIAFDDMAQIWRTRTRVQQSLRWLAVPLALSAATLAGVALIGDSRWAAEHQAHIATVSRAAISAVPLALTVSLLVLLARGHAWTLPIIVLFTAGELAFWSYSYAYRWGPLMSVEELAQEALVPPDAQPGDVLPTVLGGKDHLVILRGLRLTTGYTGLYPRTTVDFRDPTVERLAGITWRGDGDRWSRVDNALPRARLLASAQASSNVAADLKNIDVNNVALVDTPLALSGNAGTAHVVSERPGFFDIQASAPGPQLLVLTERYHRGWRASIDGVRRAPIRVYADFLGVPLDAGEHRVILEFAPDSVRRGWQLTGLGVVLTIIGAVIIEWRRWLRAT